MCNNLGKKIAVIVLLVGLVSIALGGFFIQTGFAKADLLHETMVKQNITYTGAGGTISGIIDTPQEAQAMADVLQEHSSKYGSYSAMTKDDPNRQTVLNALTMSSSLELAVLGFGLTDIVKATGAFMVLIGLALGLIAIPTLRQKKQKLE